MKTFKFLLVAILLGTFGSTSAQNEKAAGKSTYLVQVPHTQEQCMNMLNEMKGQGNNLLSKFEFGCMSGDHTGYAFLEGTSEDNVRKMLPEIGQKTAKLKKVNKFTADQIDKMHKEHM